MKPVSEAATGQLWRSYGVGVITVAMALGVGRLLPSPPLEPSRSALFLAAVAISSWLGGRGPGLLATALSPLAIEWFLMPPAGLTLSVDEAMRIAMFVFVALLISSLNTRRLHAESALGANEVEFLVARRIQQKLVPAIAIVTPRFEVHGVSEPALATSGDYLDLLRLADERWLIAVGDVCGHGLGPALLMASTRAYLRVLAKEQRDLTSMIRALNTLLWNDTDDDQFVTLFVAALDSSTGSLTYLGAGHEGHLIRADGSSRRLESTAPPLGIDDSIEVAGAPTIQLAPGDLVALLTDGIVETVSSRGDYFGVHRFLEVMHSQRGQSSHCLIAALQQSVRRFAGTAPPRDDMTAVVVRAIDRGSATA